MDRRECIVISDATSVQPLCRSRVDLSIIGLVAEAVEVEVVHLLHHLLLYIHVDPLGLFWFNEKT